MTINRRDFLKLGALAATEVGLMSLGLPGAANVAAAAEGKAQVYYNAKIFTSDKNKPSATAFVVENGKFVYVGDDAGALKYGSGTDLKGKRILPGFLDTHSHTVMASSLSSLGGITVDLAWDLKTTLAHIAEKANDDVRKNEKFVVGMGIGPRCRPNLAKDLDAIVPDRPVFIISLDGHACWLNTLAMERAKLTKDTPDPIPGSSFFERDEDGNPTGYVVETTAVVFVMRRLGLFTPDMIQAAYPKVQAMYSRYGYTGLIDTGFATVAENIGLQAFKQLEEAGELKMRAFTCYHYLGEVAENPDEALAAMKVNREKFSSELVQPTTLKLFTDGTLEVLTAWLFDGYSAHGSGLPVIPVLTYDDMVYMTQKATDAGFHVHTHAIGDAAISQALDVYEKVGKTATTKTICHVQIMPKDGVRRFGKLRDDVIYQTTPIWLMNDPFAREALGEERFLRQVPLASLIKEGVTLTFGSDYPIARGEASLNPFNNMWVAVNRSTDDQFAPPKSEGITVPDCIVAYTINAAKQFGAADRIGSITEGKSADFVVCSDDILEIAPQKLKDVAVDATYFRGEQVYQS